jgi:hypothetical protein
MVMAGSGQTPPVYQPVPLIVPGPLGIGVSNMRIPADATYAIVSVRAMVGTPSVGSSVICDVLINGTTIFTTQANRPTVPAGLNASTVTVPDVTQLTTGSYLQLQTVQVGSTSPASDLCVVVTLQRTGS